MDIKDLTERVKDAASKHTPEERAYLLREAHILDENGEFHKEYFNLRNLYVRLLREH